MLHSTCTCIIHLVWFVFERIKRVFITIIIMAAALSQDASVQELSERQFQAMLKCLQKERDDLIATSQTKAKYGDKVEHFPCQLCVNLVFTRKQRLFEHLCSDHERFDHCCCSSKQFIIVKSLWTQVGATSCINEFFGVESHTKITK